MGERFKGRVAIVTGAGRGIGRTVAMLLAEEGASVVVNDLGGAVDGSGGSSTPADEVVEEIRRAGGSAAASHESVAELDSAGRIVRQTIDTFGRLDVLVNVAGVLRDRMVFNMSEAEWDTVLGVHLHGAFNMVRSAIPHMIAQRYGRIVLFSSISGLRSSGQANYAAAKEGTVGFARALAGELGPFGISVNAVYPGAATRMTATVPDTARQMRKQAAVASGDPTAKSGQIIGIEGPSEAHAPENNAPKVVYLASEAGGTITGQVIGTAGWAMELFSPRHVVRSIHKRSRWTLDELDRLMPISLTAGLVNPVPPAPPKQ
jgi:NAD(P)-dependent dehydrogenase (short-subunit alcohol dehydrogenase family)